jgi:Cof subfamily protein (haloacid dehalogenase superfamily)
MARSFKRDNIRALALDLDGTLLGPGGVLSERTVRAVRASRDRGLGVIIATGRAVEAAEKFRIPLGVEGPMVYFNGAVVADMPGGRVLNSTLLDLEAAVFCLRVAREMGVYYQVFFPGTPEHPRETLMAEQAGPGRDMYHNHTGMLADLGDVEKALDRPGLPGCIKGMFIAEPPVQDRVRARIEERFGGAVYIARTYGTFLEVLSPRISKGKGLLQALEHRGLKPEELIAFGDEENDLPMFEAASWALAPENAKDRVKKAADQVIGSNADDGVAAFLEQTFLDPPAEAGML